MFYPEFTISPWLVSAVLVAVFGGVFFALGSKYLEIHINTLFPFSPGKSALNEEEALRQELAARLHWLWGEKGKVAEVPVRHRV